MNDALNATSYLIKLKRLWKGTLFIGIAALYIAVVTGSFFIIDWQIALLSFGMIVLSQFFRYVSNEVDRIGWILRDQTNKTTLDARRWRRSLLGLLTTLTLLPIIALVVYLYSASSWLWSASCLMMFFSAEVFYLEIRRVNRQVSYREASYGFPEHAPLNAATVQATVASRGQKELEEKLALLESLAKEGKISSKAYERARDKYWIQHVMNSTE